MMHFVRAFSIMPAEDVRLIAFEEVRSYGKLYTSKAFLKMAGGRMHTPHATPSPGSAPGHKLQKPSKESGIFSHLAPLILLFCTKRQSQEGGAWHNPLPKYAPAVKSKKGLPVLRCPIKNVRSSARFAIGAYVSVSACGPHKMVSRAVCCPCLN